MKRKLSTTIPLPGKREGDLAEKKTQSLYFFWCLVTQVSTSTSSWYVLDDALLITFEANSWSVFPSTSHHPFLDIYYKPAHLETTSEIFHCCCLLLNQSQQDIHLLHLGSSNINKVRCCLLFSNHRSQPCIHSTFMLFKLTSEQLLMSEKLSPSSSSVLHIFT